MSFLVDIPRNLEVEEELDLELHLEDIVPQWIDVWTKAGGIEMAFGE